MNLINFFEEKFEKIQIFKNFNFVIFSTNFWQPSSSFSTSKKSIDQLFLPDEIYFEPSSIRKWIQIRIWTYEPSFNFDFKTLASSLCCRLHFFNFPWHRITLRVGMETILLYESLYSWGLAGRAAAQKIFWNNAVLLIFIEFFGKKFEKSKSSKISILSFFPQFLPTFVRIFNLEKIYRPTIPSGWDIFRTELYPKMNSDLNLNGWTIL